MIRKSLPYCIPVLIMNLILSPIATFFAILFLSSFLEKEITLSGVLMSFIISFLTGGYIFGILYFELARKREYYFYYNLGISKLRLILTTYLFHIILIIPVLIIALYAKYI
jgi:hypothetical protein